jgi:hypothetical protein
MRFDAIGRPAFRAARPKPRGNRSLKTNTTAPRPNRPDSTAFLYDTAPHHANKRPRTRTRPTTPAMALSKSTRIMILLGIDSVFFLLELIVGYAVHSLALVADSFHMVCSFRCEPRAGADRLTAQRRYLTPCRTVGSQGGKREVELQDVHLRCE